MAERPAVGLHRLGYEPRVRFVRDARGGHHAAECVVCNETFVADEPEHLEALLDRHRELIHVVMVYPYGMPRPEPRRRHAKREAAHG